MKRFFTYVFSIISVVVLSACNQLGLAIVNLPSGFDANKEIHDVAFGSHSQTLNIHLPEGTKANDAKPVLIFFYGGRWTDGSKEQYRFVGSRFAKHGYITVIPDYRKYPDVKFPEFVKDNADAVAWVQDNIAQYGGDPENIYLMGHSAGAMNAALLAADERYLKNAGANISSIRAFAGLAGPYDFEPDAEDLKDMFGPPNNYPNMQVTTFIDGNEPPMFLLWGEDDTTVYLSNLEKLQKGIQDKNGEVQSKIYPDLDHVGIIKVLTWVYKNTASVENDILDFFAAHSPYKDDQKN